MATTYWNKTTNGYNNGTYCYGYYQGQYYSSSYGYVVSGNYMDWAYYDGSIHLKLGTSSGGYYWYSVSAKRVYTNYKDTTSGFDDSSNYVYFYWNNSSVTTTLKSYTDLGITPPSGKVFKEWNTEEDGSGDSYQAGDTITDKAGNINSKSKTRILYAIWDGEGEGGSGDSGSGTEEPKNLTRYWHRGYWYDQMAQEVIRITGSTETELTPEEMLEKLKSIS